MELGGVARRRASGGSERGHVPQGHVQLPDVPKTCINMALAHGWPYTPGAHLMDTVNLASLCPQDLTKAHLTVCLFG